MDLTLDRLVSVSAPSGREDELRELITKTMLPKGYTAETDPAGNLLIRPEGETPKILLVAPMDEVSCLTRQISDEGLVSLTPVGDLDPAVMMGRLVDVGEHHTGVIGTKAVHMQSAEERKEPVSWDKLYLDVGTSLKEYVKRIADPGTAVTFRYEYTVCGNRVFGKTIDARLGITVLLHLISGEEIPPVSLLFAARHQSGDQGAAAYASIAKEETVITVDAYRADAFPEHEALSGCQLDGGFVLPAMDKGAVYTLSLWAKAMEVANGAAQTGNAPQNATLPQAFLAGGGGRSVISVGIPCRYPHTPLPMASLDDMNATLDFLYRLVWAL